jgi:hypothetical protein
MSIGTSIKRSVFALAVAMFAMAMFASAAGASFGITDTRLSFENEDGSPLTQAGAHPYQLSAGVDFNTVIVDEEGRIAPDEATNELITELPEGFTGVPTATPRCTGAQFAELNPAEQGAENAQFPYPNCPAGSSVGKIDVFAAFAPKFPEEVAKPLPALVYNLVPPPGKLAKFGFVFVGVPIVFDVTLSEESPYRVVSTFHHTSQALKIYGASLRMWGVPADDSHDAERGRCYATGAPDLCEVDGEGQPLVTAPSSCTGPLRADFEGNSWQHPETWVKAFAETDDGGEPPLPIGLSDCSALDFAPGITAAPTSRASSSPTGLDFGLTMKNEGVLDPKNVAASTIRKAEVTLPEGFSINPSVAEGLEVCTEAQLAGETAFSEPGDGCPSASKLGTVEVETPVLEEKVNGALYQAAPYENPFGSLVAMYIVIKNPKLGIKVVQPLKVIPDPVTGRLTTISEEMPQLPFSSFKLHFREGARSPLATPSACGAYDVAATLYPWSGTEPVNTTSTFQIITGPNEGPCPAGGLPPFHPGLQAGTRSNAAGSFSPFDLSITRADAEQEITHFSIKLPRGVAGKLVGIPSCSEEQIAAARARTGPHGGQEELENPSCPPASQVGRTLAGSGVGQVLAYAPGKVYLAGPFNGSPISFVSITSGVVGPFDIGTVVVRLAIRVNPETGEVFLDSVGSDAIPHIIHGIPIHLRDVRAFTDRPEFTFNPTNCTPTSTAATVLGSGLDFASEADDNPFVSTSRFQAADCAALTFAPKLSLRLIGGTRRGAHPALKAFLRMRGFGEAGVARTRVTLPGSEFIENAHFETICTRAQFKLEGGNGEACPPGSIYGWARAKSPILADPVEGPIFLRSSEHELPDVVASLRGQQINVHLVGHVDSVNGRLRNTFETVPDAPVEWASFSFQGQSKGLFVNSADLCKRVHKAKVSFTGQNGKLANYATPLKVKCKKGGAKKNKRRKRVAR